MTRLRSEHGFTLPELSITMFAGTIVIGALFMILIVTLRQTQRTFTKVDASRLGRITLANIENELHSACVDGGTDGNPPIQGVTNGVVESDANNLVFLSFYGTSATPQPTWHKITFNAASGGTLMETVYPVAGTSPNWTQGSPAISTRTLLTNVAQQTVGSPPNQTKVPVFQYYAYAPFTDSNGMQEMAIPDGTNAMAGGAMPNSPLVTTNGLSSTDADNTVEVVISLSVGVSAGSDHATLLHAVDAQVSDGISLRLTTPPNYLGAGVTTDQYGPCR